MITEKFNSGWSRCLLVALGLMVSIIVQMVPAVAVENGGVGGKPARPRSDNPRSESIFVHELEAGTSIEDAVLVINNTDEQKIVEVYPVDAQISSGGAFACKQKVEPREQMGSWITLSETQVTLEPKSRREIPFTIALPDNISVGEHNGCIAFQSVEAPVDSGVSGVQLSFRSAVRVAITVPGAITKEINFASRSISIREEKIIVSERLKNSGNVSLDVEIKSELKPSLFGAKQEKGGDFPVLPAQESELNFEFERPYWGGWLRLHSEATFSVDTSVSLGEQSAESETISQNTVLFVMPRAGALAVYGTVTVTLVVATLLVIRRRRKYRFMHQQSVPYRVKKGDTIQSIAQNLGIKWQDIAKLNGLKPPFDISGLSEVRVHMPTQSTEPIDGTDIEPVKTKASNVSAKKKGTSTKNKKKTPTKKKEVIRKKSEQ